MAEAFELAVNTSINPCDDFFSYVCVNWIKAHPVFEGTESYRNVRISTQERLTEVIEVVLSKRLQKFGRLLSDDSNVTSLRESEIQASKFYASCTRSQTTPNPEMYLTTLRRLFHDVGLEFFDEESTNSTTTAFSVLLSLSLRYGISPIFTVITDHSTITVTRSLPPSPNDPSSFDYSDMTVFWKIQLLEYMVKDDKNDILIVNLLGSMFNSLKILVEAVDLMRIGRHYFTIKKAIRTLFNNKVFNYNHPLSEWGRLTEFPWLKLLNRHMGGLSLVKRNHRLVMDAAYFDFMSRITTDPELTTMFKDFIAVDLLIKQFGELTGEISHRSFCSFMPTCWDLHKKVEHRCARKTIEELKWTSVAIVSRALHTDYSSYSVRYLFSLLKCVLAEELTMRIQADDSTAVAVLTRLVLLRDRVAFPRYLERYETVEYRVPMSGDDLLGNIVSVKKARQAKVLAVFGEAKHRNEPPLEYTHIFYSAIYDDVYLPGFMMDFPYLVETGPFLLSVAALGWITAHEMSHAFDNYILEAPETAPPPNATSFRKKYAEAQKCFADQFTIPVRSGYQVLGEAMADNLGYRLAIEALKYLVEKRKPTTLKVHKLDQKQLFFVVNAYIQCYATTAVKTDAQFGLHPPFYHRVNRGLSNIGTFSKAFQCSISDAMVAKPRCKI